MKKKIQWVKAAILTLCGMTMVSCFSDTKKSAAVSATDDTSQFVTITDVVAPSRLQAFRHRVVALHPKGRALP